MKNKLTAILDFYISFPYLLFAALWGVLIFLILCGPVFLFAIFSKQEKWIPIGLWFRERMRAALCHGPIQNESNS
jgi:hypothetical protein